MKRLVPFAIVAVVAIFAAVVFALIAVPPVVVSQRFEAPPGLSESELWDVAIRLTGCTRFADEIHGPEEIEIDESGRIYTGEREGRVLRLTPQADGQYRIEVLAHTGGHPQGITLDRQGRLLVSEGYHVSGARIDGRGGVERLPELRGGDSAVSSAGAIYFGAPPDWKRTGDVLIDFAIMLLEARPTGELRVLEPGSSESRVLSSGLIIPDGVALSSNEDFVAVGEVGGFRISRYWLRGPRAGTTDYLIEGLPGLPDGVASDGWGCFFVALPMLRSALGDLVHRSPWLKDQLAKILEWATPPLAGSEDDQQPGWIAVIAEDGTVEAFLVEPDGLAGPGITTAVPHGNDLFLSSLSGRGIVRCPLPPALRDGTARRKEQGKWIARS